MKPSTLLPIAAALSALALPLSAQDTAVTPASAAEAASDASTATTAWNFDPDHCVIGFHINHMGLSDVLGRFNELSGLILANTDDPTASTVEFSAQVASIDTGVPKRDEDLRSENFFNVAEYPQITFTSSEVEAIDGGYLVTGNLTIKDQTHEVEIPLTVNGPIGGMEGEQRIGASGELTIDRTDYGLDYGIQAIGTEVTINLQVEAILEQAGAE